MSKQEWKESGSELGHAFKTFGKTFVRSAKTTGDKVADWADDKSNNPSGPKPQPESTVYSDGSWKETGKQLGGAFAGVGKTLLHTVGFGSTNPNNAAPNPDNATQNTDNASQNPNAAQNTNGDGMGSNGTVQ